MGASLTVDSVLKRKKVGHELMPSFTLLSRDDRHKTYRPKLKHLTAQ